MLFAGDAVAGCRWCLLARLLMFGVVVAAGVAVDVRWCVMVVVIR